MQKLRLLSLMTAAGALLSTTQSNAAGYAIRETGNLLGQSFAGSAAIAGDVSTMAANPATMASLTKNQVAAFVSWINPSAKFSQTSATPHTGGNDNGGENAFVPAFYGAWDAHPNFKLGLAITSPFGLKTKYKSTWVGRYDTIKSSMQSFNVNPSAAFKINDEWAIGFGVSAQYVDVELIKAVRTAGADATSRVRGHDLGMGANFGVTYEPMKGTRFGLAYRSVVSHGIDGHLSVKSSTGTTLIGEHAVTDLRTPDSLTFSASHEINPEWSVMGDIQWTGWSNFRTLKIKGANSGTLRQDQVFGWKSTMFYALGVNYKPNKDWVLRVGTAYDQTPTKTATRTAAIPDQNRIWASCGVDYNYGDAWTFKLAYAHLFVKKAAINFSTAANTALGGAATNYQGRFKSSVNMVGLQANWKF